MAERRMFAKTIIDSDAFLEMPQSSQNLYFHLCMRADDDGFLNNPKKIARMVGCNDDDLKIILAKRFIIAFDTGVIVIKHWKIHNYIAKDRYKETVYKEEKASLQIKNNGSYTDCIQNVDSLTTQVRLGEDRIGKDRKGKEKNIGRFTPPTLDEVTDYCQERGNDVDPQRFLDYYASKGWMVGKTKMVDWRAAVRNWEKPKEPKEKIKICDHCGATLFGSMQMCGKCGSQEYTLK